VSEEQVDPRVEQVRAVRLEHTRDENRCLWCHEHVPEQRRGTRACNEWHATLWEAERKGRDTCCQVCREQDAVDFTLSQLQRRATTCSGRHRKIKYRIRRNT
jgi:hypothetical protein